MPGMLTWEYLGMTAVDPNATLLSQHLSPSVHSRVSFVGIWSTKPRTLELEMLLL